MKKWPQLLVDIEKLIDAEVKPNSEGAKRLAQQWLSMLQGYTGENPSTQERFVQQCKMNQALLTVLGLNRLPYTF